MPTIKNVRLKPVDNGFAVKHDYCEDVDPKTPYDTIRNVSTRIDVYKDNEGSKALARVIELKEMDNNTDFKTFE